MNSTADVSHGLNDTVKYNFEVFDKMDIVNILSCLVISLSKTDEDTHFNMVKWCNFSWYGVEFLGPQYGENSS